MKRLKLICFYFALTIGLYAQNGVLKFQSTNHDFGIIDTQIQGNLITCSFPFVNQGTDAITINEVIISYNYIQADYPSSPIQPNGEGVITVKYDLSSEISSMLHSGQPTKSFRKGITILSNSKQQRLNRLFISGKIKANMPEEVKMREQNGFIWYKIFKNGKTGAKDINGNEIIPVEYKEISYDNNFFTKGFRVVGDNHCEGFYSITGKNVIPISRGYSHVDKRSRKEFGTFYIFRKDNIAGFCDINGKEVIRFLFSCEDCNIVPCYEDGKFYIEYSTGDIFGTSGIIDGNGNTIVGPVNGSITLNKETSSFECYSDEENKRVSCGRLSDIRTTKNPLASNPLQ